MLTRCPHCQTCFRVTAEQLKVRQGQVRCGECRAVFSALDSLADEALIVARAPGVPVEAAAAAETRRAQDGAGEVVVDTSEAAAQEITEPAPESAPVVVPEPVAEKLVAPEAGEWTPVSAPPPPPRRWPWVTGVLLLSFLAAGQLAYLLRTELAVLMPGLRPALMTGCAVLGCTLPRPRKPEMVGIEASDLAPEDSGLLLTATLQNRAPFVQDYPYLELTLTDTQDQALVRKILPPTDYLPADRPVNDGFAAHGEVAVKLLLDASAVPAAGYRLYLFYP